MRLQLAPMCTTAIPFMGLAKLAGQTRIAQIRRGTAAAYPIRHSSSEAAALAGGAPVDSGLPLMIMIFRIRQVVWRSHVDAARTLGLWSYSHTSTDGIRMSAATTLSAGEEVRSAPRSCRVHINAHRERGPLSQRGARR